MPSSTVKHSRSMYDRTHVSSSLIILLTECRCLQSAEVALPGSGSIASSRFSHMLFFPPGKVSSPTKCRWSVSDLAVLLQVRLENRHEAQSYSVED